MRKIIVKQIKSREKINGVLGIVLILLIGIAFIASIVSCEEQNTSNCITTTVTKEIIKTVTVTEYIDRAVPVPNEIVGDPPEVDNNEDNIISVPETNTTPQVQQQRRNLIAITPQITRTPANRNRVGSQDNRYLQWINKCYPIWRYEENGVTENEIEAYQKIRHECRLLARELNLN